MGATFLFTYKYTYPLFIGQLSVDGAFELIMHSDVYLMTSLKKFCANVIGNHVSHLDVIDIIKMSRMLNLPKLEKTAIEHIAYNLEQVCLKQIVSPYTVSSATPCNIYHCIFYV